MSHRSDFDLDDDVVWLNSAHQSALPRVAAQAAAEAVGWKQRPWELTAERFSGVPAALREALGGLVGVPAGEIILTNGASFGLHALANGLPLEADDEVLVMRGDFPSNILPWRLQERRGVRVRALHPDKQVLRPDEIVTAFSPRTRVACVSWVHSFSGHALDIEAIGEACRKAGVWLVVNVTQGLGARPIDLGAMPVDAVVDSGWKWLCGPYATGFAWIRPELLDRMECRQAYWLSMQTAEDLARDDDPALPDAWGPRQFEIFGTANFFNFRPFHASVAYLGGIGLERVNNIVDGLVDRFVGGLDRGRYALVSPERGSSRSSLAVFSHREPARNPSVQQRLHEAGVVTAHRRGNIRVSPHLYNTPDDIDRALEVLNAG